MSVRQYIGARYVTKIYENSLDPSSAEWEAGVTYEPLTMVTYNNGSYLSKKDVPGSVGDPASNPIYWVQTGFYNGQITFLQSEIDDLQNSRALNIENRKFLCVGDSYGDESGEWPDVIKTSLNISNDNFNNVCTDAAGFINWGNGTYEDQLTNFTGDKSSITDIIIAGGLNDSRYNTYAAADAALSPAIASCASYISANYPNATVWIAFIGSCLPSSTYYSTVPLNNRKITRYIYEGSGMMKNWRLLGGVVNTIHSAKSNYKSGGIHPSTLGSNLIGQAIATIISGGQYSTYYPPTNFVTLGSGFSGTIAMKYEVIGNETIFSIQGKLEITSATLSASNLEIGTLSGIEVPNPITVHAECTIDKGSGSPRYIDHDCAFIFENDKVYLRCEKINSAGSGYDNIAISNGAVLVNTTTALTVSTCDFN